MTYPIQTVLFGAGLQIAAVLLATAGVKLGYFDQDMAIRITMTTMGLMMLIYANFASKVVSRSARALALNRFVAWSLTLGFLVWTGIWLFAPMDVANIVATCAVGLSVIVAVGYGVRSFRSATP